MLKRKRKKSEEEEIKETDEELDAEEEDEEEVKDEIEEEVKEDLKGFIEKTTEDASEKALDKKIDAMALDLVEKFFAGVEDQRVAGKKDVSKYSKSGEARSRDWIKAFLDRDHSTLRRMEKEYIQAGDLPSGGYLVPPELLAEINRFTEEYGVARRDMRYLPFSGKANSRTIPALAGGVVVNWTDEAGGKKSTTPKFGIVTQALKKITAIVPLTEEILEDSAIDIISLLGELIGEAIALEEDNVFLTNATATPFKGILHADGTEEYVLASGKKAKDITADDLDDMTLEIPASARRGAKFYLSSSVWSVVKKLRSNGATGDYIVQKPTEGSPGLIWEYPYELVDVLPDKDTGTGKEPVLFFGNLKKTCAYGDKQGIRVKLLDQAIVESAGESPSDLNLATQDMIAVRTVKRVGYVPILPSGIVVLKTAQS